jgi:hypothetical protein
MRTVTTQPNIEEFKIRASILIKELRAGSAAAEARIQAVRRAGERWKRKDALAVIAREAGFPSWTSLKARYSLGNAADTELLFSRPGTGAFLNRWFRSYAEAKSSLASEGGYLFPYRNQYFVCEDGFVDGLNLEAAPEDWEKIGRNWIEPLDREAWARLYAAFRRRGLMR